MKPIKQTMFTNLIQKGKADGFAPGRTQAARDWYRAKARNIRSPERRLASEPDRMKNRVLIGHMYFFDYDPKHKETLPYYDTFPLIFPINKAKGGFLGINFHYLPPVFRAQLMDALYSIASDKRYDENTKMMISYKVLKSAAKFAAFKPCIKHYLTDHVKSPFIKIDASEWDIALFLPVADFKKAPITRVYADSLRKIR